MKAKTLLFSVLILGSGTLFAQGSLEPPGAPGPTMKTLQQIEPRIPVSAAGTLSAAGSYYLTQDISGAMVLSADNITLDLNGFAMGGGDPTINIGSRSHVQIFNGRLRNGPKTVAIAANGASNVQIHDLTIHNYSVCIFATATDGPFTIQNVSCDTTSSHGFELDGDKATVPSFRVVDNILSNNTFGAKGPAAIEIGGTGIATEVLMTGNRVLRSANGGIDVGGGGGVIESAGNAAVEGVPSGTFGVIADNYVVNCSATGITVSGNYVVTKNIVQGCTTAYDLKGAPNAAPVTNIGFSPEPWDNITDQGLF